MRPVLPSNFGRKCFVTAVLIASWLATACHPEARGAESPPGEPIPAEPDIKLGSVDDECKGLVDAITAYGACPNSDEDERAWARRVVEVAQQAFDAGKHGKQDEQTLRVMALACHKAAVSMQYATIRCKNGPPPKAD
ncbi:MAG TPA: hypothetical protein VH143_27715 [Kofleriaceae bacterium]|jgi:hypothetical protein|nr:hypothetical protein [Kofleriaceae bacterium]